MLHISELSVRTAKPQIDDLVMAFGDLLPALDLSCQIGNLLPESDVLVDELLPLFLRSVDGEAVDSQTDVPREGGMYRQNYCGCRFSDAEAAAERVVNLVSGWNREIQEMMGGMGINAIDSLRGNRLMLRGVGLNEKELEILGVKYAGE